MGLAGAAVGFKLQSTKRWLALQLAVFIENKNWRGKPKAKVRYKFKITLRGAASAN